MTKEESEMAGKQAKSANDVLGRIQNFVRDPLAGEVLDLIEEVGAYEAVRELKAWIEQSEGPR